MAVVRVSKDAEKPNDIDGSDKDRPSPPQWEEPCQWTRLGARNYSTGGRCAGASRRGALKKRVGKAREDRGRAHNRGTSGRRARARGTVDKAPSNTTGRPCQQVRLSACNRNTSDCQARALGTQVWTMS